MKKRIVILTGAGAVIPWGAPTTSQITQKITDDDEFVTVSGKTLGKYFYDILTLFFNLDPESVNFETIINLVEDLYGYYCSKYIRGYSEFKSSLPTIFNVKCDIESDILDFGSIYNEYNNTFFLSKHEKVSWLKDYINQFFEQVYYHFINLIIEEIGGYSNNYTNSKYIKQNTAFGDFLNYYSDRSIRFYTLNYDRIPIHCSTVNFFDGFDK